MMRRIFVAALFLSGFASAGSLTEYLLANGQPPVDYVLSKLDDHRIVILGEGHWGRRDTELVAALVPGLRRRGVALAMEFFSYESQQKLDRLVSEPEWNAALANEILREAEWTYVQYRDILNAAWKVNRLALEEPALKVIALGPPKDFRARKIGYDATMARLVKEYSTDESKRVLAYCGMHHAFTRYLQVERRGRGRATEFMDRFGNILWRQYGEDVFLIALHKPEWCGPDANPTSVSCPPFGGAIDCSGAAVGHAVAFDVIGSPIAELKFPESSFYFFGHPHLRFVDYTDGYVWTGAVDDLPRVDLIPLEEVSPADAKKADAVRAWNKEAESLAHPLARPGMQKLGAWRDACRAPAP